MDYTDLHLIRGNPCKSVAGFLLGL